MRWTVAEQGLGGVGCASATAKGIRSHASIRSAKRAGLGSVGATKAPLTDRMLHATLLAVLPDFRSRKDATLPMSDC